MESQEPQYRTGPFPLPPKRGSRRVDENAVQETHLTSRPFLLMEGGPLFHLEKRMGLIAENAPLRKRIAVLAAVVTWLPLLVLSALQGRAFGHSVVVPFLRDFGAYTRFLLAVPLLILAENLLAPRLAEAAAHFVDSGVVQEKSFKQFDNIVDRQLRLRDSVLAEVILVILAYIFSIIGFKLTAVHLTSWYATRTDGALSLTWAGWWLTAFCTPLFQFLALRWLWRLFLWFQFLGRVQDLDLQLYPTHADEAGGLGFVGEAQRFFGILLLAFSVGSAGVLANDIVYDKVPLRNFLPAIGVYVVTALIILIGPLLLFAGTLLKTKREGLREYGTLSTAYSGEFYRKWILLRDANREPLLGTEDIRSLADLGNSYALVQKMKAMPIDPLTILHLVIASLLPMIPLLLTVMPLKDILKLLMKVWV